MKRDFIEIRRKLYKNVREACEDLGLNYKAVLSEKNRSGKTYEEVINFKLDNDRSVKINGVDYPSLHEACRRLGVTYRVIKRYYDIYNTDPEVTLAKYLEKFINNEIQVKNKIMVNGKSYSSVAKACTDLGVNINMVRKFSDRYPELCLTTEEIIEKEVSGELDKLKEVVKQQRAEKKRIESGDLRGHKPTQSCVDDESKFITKKKVGTLSIKEFAILYSLDYPSFKEYIRHNNFDDIEDAGQLIDDYKSLPMEPAKSLEMANKCNVPYTKFRQFITGAYDVRGMSEEDIMFYFTQSKAAQKGDQYIPRIKMLSPENYEREIKLREKNNKKIWTYKGKKYLSLQDICTDLGISSKKLYKMRSNIAKYRNSDDTLEELIDIIVNNKN